LFEFMQPYCPNRPSIFLVAAIDGKRYASRHAGDIPLESLALDSFNYGVVNRRRVLVTTARHSIETFSVCSASDYFDFSKG
jgi:hypothetical protein